jgi:hypothetical protein
MPRPRQARHDCCFNGAMGTPDAFEIEHEINTRPTRIGIAGQMLLRRGDPGQDQKRWVDQILQAARELEGVRETITARPHPAVDP